MAAVTLPATPVDVRGRTQRSGAGRGAKRSFAGHSRSPRVVRGRITYLRAEVEVPVAGRFERADAARDRRREAELRRRRRAVGLLTRIPPSLPGDDRTAAPQE